ncbi:hypothetical protein KTAU_38810 [Thermogemmatispora aurantia]|jgi:hypothetical protein|uniref:Uncharacterized protein n=1 Tax=Thermogemmatispora aurantia TaxID=2045279 RepID=A0A5J4KHW2_9CHLR|nr:hypothetical protein [Thermogemmatispora aurantia]GER85246.1 hypothetical protein KTAU_38810 [Thermogemmatispora aurantia]
MPAPPPPSPEEQLPLLRLISRLSAAAERLRQQEIIAPLLPGGRIRTRIEGLVYEFKVRASFAGWGRFRPRDEQEAELLGEALPWQRGAYLELLPALRMILLWPVSGPRASQAQLWLALPFNPSDARQRFGLPDEPLPVLLCDPFNGAEPFERIVARVDDQTLWFDGPDLRADPTHAAWMREAVAAPGEEYERFPAGLTASERRALLLWDLHRLEEEALRQELRVASFGDDQAPDAKQRTRGRFVPTAGRPVPEQVAQAQSRRAQLEWLQQERLRLQLSERLRHALAKAGAVLHSYTLLPASSGSTSEIIVEWSEEGRPYRYRSVIDPELTIVSSGICLSGRDRDFDLTSIVSVMRDSPWSEEELEE